MKLTSIGMLSVFVGCLGAQTSTQSESQTTTTTTTTSGAPVNMEGTLVDQGCYTTHSHSKETTSNSNPNSTTTVETTKNSSDCPATTFTTNFGLTCSGWQDGSFDDAGDRRVVDMMKSDRTFSEDIHGHRPVVPLLFSA